jgi:cytoskeletal protein CcmA (bactofilin family)
MDTDKATLIDSHAEIEGSLKGKDAHVLGRFQGTLELSGRFVVGEGARVEALVTADAAEIAGEFKGELKVRSVVLMEKARVDASLDTQNITIREGAQLNGKVSAGGAPRPAPSPSASPAHGPAAGPPLGPPSPGVKTAAG